MSGYREPVSTAGEKDVARLVKTNGTLVDASEY
jgi:hypothetical protein